MTLNKTNANSQFQHFEKCDYNLHWSWSNFFRQIFVAHQLTGTVVEIGAGDSVHDDLADYNFGKDVKFYKYDVDTKYTDCMMLDIAKEALPHKDNSVDCVIMAEVIEHLTEYKGKLAIKEIHRVLKPGGYLFLSTPTPMKSIDEHCVWPQDHAHEYSFREISVMLRKQFDVEQTMPWSINRREFIKQLKYDKFIMELNARLQDVMPESFRVALTGLLTEPHSARQVIFKCKKRKPRYENK